MDSLRDQIARLTTEFIQDVAELPDRTSPDDWPEAMLITAEELKRGLDWYSSEILKLIEPRGESELREALEKIASTPVASEEVLSLSDADDEPGLGDWRRGENAGIKRCADIARQALATPSAPVSGLEREVQLLGDLLGEMADHGMFHGDEDTVSRVTRQFYIGPGIEKLIEHRRGRMKEAAELIEQRDEEIARLKSALASRDEWRPDMENAPRDGRQVDLIINGAFRLPDCKWGKEEPHREPTWLNYKPHPDALHDCEWQEIDAKDVTHWMLRPMIPTPPTSQERKS